MMIRRIEETDFESIKKLAGQVHKLHVHNRPDIYEDTDPFDKPYFEFLLADQNTVSLVCEIGQEAVGFCIMTIREPSQNPILKPRRVAYVEDLCVDEKNRQCGIGKALLNEIKSMAKDRGADTLELMVWSFNESAIRFYENAGMACRSIIMEEKL